MSSISASYSLVNSRSSRSGSPVSTPNSPMSPNYTSGSEVELSTRYIHLPEDDSKEAKSSNESLLFSSNNNRTSQNQEFFGRIFSTSQLGVATALCEFINIDDLKSFLRCNKSLSKYKNFLLNKKILREFARQLSSKPLWHSLSENFHPPFSPEGFLLEHEFLKPVVEHWQKKSSLEVIKRI